MQRRGRSLRLTALRTEELSSVGGQKYRTASKVPGTTRSDRRDQLPPHMHRAVSCPFGKPGHGQPLYSTTHVVLHPRSHVHHQDRLCDARIIAATRHGRDPTTRATFTHQPSAGLQQQCPCDVMLLTRSKLEPQFDVAELTLTTPPCMLFAPLPAHPLTRSGKRRAFTFAACRIGRAPFTIQRRQRPRHQSWECIISSIKSRNTSQILWGTHVY